MNIEALKLAAKKWFERGDYHCRSESECHTYVCAAEDATLIAFDSMGKTSIATFQSHKVYDELSRYFDELMGFDVE